MSGSEEKCNFFQIFLGGDAWKSKNIISLAYKIWLIIFWSVVPDFVFGV